MELVPELTFPEGKLSIRSTLEAIYKNEEAWKFFTETLKLPLTPAHGMWGMVSKMTVEGLMSMSGEELPEAVMATLNAQLNKFDLIA